MKLALVANKSWWVPASNATKLAVQIESEQEYLPAIEAKLLELVEKEGMPQAFKTAAWLMEPQGVTLEPTDDPETLVEHILATSSLGERVRAGAPWLAAPASPADAEEAVEQQQELSLADFLT